MTSQNLRNGAKPSPITTWRQSFALNPTKPSPLLDLPRELRDMILEALLLRNKPLRKAQCNCHTCMNRRFMAAGRRDGLPPETGRKSSSHNNAIVPTEILGSCRQLCHEAAAVSFPKNTFHFGSGVRKASYNSLLRNIRLSMSEIDPWDLILNDAAEQMFGYLIGDAVWDIHACIGTASKVQSIVLETKVTRQQDQSWKDAFEDVDLIAPLVEDTCSRYNFVLPRTLKVSMMYQSESPEEAGTWVELMPGLQPALDRVKALQQAGR